MTAVDLPESDLPTIPPPLALSFDLDDTLWPIWPTIERAERRLHDWLVSRAPATARRFDVPGLRALRNAFGERHPEWGHDLSRLRLESVREALVMSGDDAALAEPAFDVFFEARQQVVLYPDVAQALDRLAARYPLVAVTNGNADLSRLGLDRLFPHCLSASGFGVGKPDPRIFLAACERVQASPWQVLHVGDDLMLDVDGALGAGLQALWLRRGVPASDPVPPLRRPYHVLDQLTRLADALNC